MQRQARNGNGNGPREQASAPGGRGFYNPANGQARGPPGYDSFSAHAADDYRRGAAAVEGDWAMRAGSGYGPGWGSPPLNVQPVALVHSPGATPWQDASRPPYPHYPGHPSPLRGGVPPPPGAGSPARPSSASGRYPPHYPPRPGSASLSGGARSEGPGGPTGSQRARQQLSASMDSRGDVSRRSAKANPNLVRPPAHPPSSVFTLKTCICAALRHGPLTAPPKSVANTWLNVRAQILTVSDSEDSQTQLCQNYSLASVAASLWWAIISGDSEHTLTPCADGAGRGGAGDSNGLHLSRRD